MTVCIIKPCKVRHDAAVMELVPGDYLNVPPGKEAKLIETNHARPVVAADYGNLATEFKQRDPGADCWTFIKKNHPDLWRQQIRAMLSDDIATARLNYNRMLSIWAAAKPTCERNQP